MRFERQPRIFAELRSHRFIPEKRFQCAGKIFNIADIHHKTGDWRFN